MNYPYLGTGLGLRTEHYDYVLQNKPNIDWFEIVSENFMVAGGKPRYYLDAISEEYPIVMHGVSLSIGSSDPLNWEYLRALKSLKSQVQPAWISDHLCWTGVNSVNAHDLLPMPYTEEAIKHIVERIDIVQNFLGQQILIENVSSYLTYNSSAMSEWDFYSQVVEQANCLMLLDINNIYVSSRNHGFDAKEYIKSINSNRVQQIHLAGHSDYGDYVIDTHDRDICDQVWDLFSFAIKQFGNVSSMIERDDNVPEFELLELEYKRMKKIIDESHSENKQTMTSNRL